MVLGNPKWYWVALRPNEMAFQITDSDRQGFISDLKTLRGVENRLSKIKGADWAMTMREVPSRIEVYTYVNPYDISSYRKIKAWSI